MEYIWTTLDNLQTSQSKVVDLISKIQYQFIERKYHLDEANESEEELPVSESTPALVGPSTIQIDINIPDTRVHKGSLSVQLKE